MQETDVIIIGGGIVGLSVAYNLTQAHPDKAVIVLEKEPELAGHQTGHNSGVIHSGIYYRPGSLKAGHCREGNKALQAFCDAHGVRYEMCGKVIVGVDQDEVPRLKDLYERGKANGVCCEMIGPERLAELEPHCAGVRAVHVHDAGIVDFVAMSHRLADAVRDRGGQVITRARVKRVDPCGAGVAVESEAGDFAARHLVNCAGLHCDRVTRLTGQRPKAKIIPFRGEYFELKPEARHLCRHLIYPTPDPRFPFLGVHFTRTVDGSIECGPNAVFAFAREGYHKTDLDLIDLVESLTYPGFLRMAARYWRMGAARMAIGFWFSRKLKSSKTSTRH